MVFEVTRLQFHSTAYIKDNKHKSWYFIYKRSSKYYEWQQECQIAQGLIIDETDKDRSKSSNH